MGLALIKSPSFQFGVPLAGHEVILSLSFTTEVILQKKRSLSLPSNRNHEVLSATGEQSPITTKGSLYEEDYALVIQLIEVN